MAAGPVLKLSPAPMMAGRGLDLDLGPPPCRGRDAVELLRLVGGVDDDRREGGRAVAVVDRERVVELHLAGAQIGPDAGLVLLVRLGVDAGAGAAGEASGGQRRRRVAAAERSLGERAEVTGYLLPSGGGPIVSGPARSARS